MKKLLFAAALSIAMLPGTVYAQPDRQSHFGVIATLSPESKASDQLKFLFDVERMDVRSRDFEIGLVVRGRELGGDWGVSYFQKKYKDGSVLDSTDEQCVPNCQRFGQLDIMQDVQLRGLMVHKFVPFVTIKRRGQIGLNFGGGVAWPKGTTQRHTFDQTFVPPNTIVSTETVSQADAKEIFLDGHTPVPVFKLEVAGAVLVAPGLKVRVGGGINFMNYPEVSISALYLFGTKR